MPTVLDATVVNSAYDTSGNGGRKLVWLSNGWLVSALVNNGLNPSEMNLYKSTDNGQTWSRLCYFKMGGNSSSYQIAIVHKNTTVYCVVTDLITDLVSFYKVEATTQTNVDISGSKVNIDSLQTEFSGHSLAINEAGTELHAAWASKNATYPNSFNVRYAKGTINADGSVTWGAVEQRTTVNTTGNDRKNPTIITDKNGYPVIIYDFTVSGANGLRTMKYNGTSWTSEFVLYDGGTYTQSSPSAIFVPQSVNGLANGRIGVSWDGTDSTDTTARNIRFAYSDDGGVTWTVVPKLTSGNSVNRMNASLTANKNNEWFILYRRLDNNNALQLKFDGTAWGTETTVIAKNAPFASTLFDNSFTLNFSSPLFIVQNNTDSKVGFYGTWTTTEISVTPGDLGQKTDGSNLLTYSITTDGTMSQITEKVNGVTVGTKTATSGQSLIAGLTQEQWDAVRFGRYDDLSNMSAVPSDEASWEQGGAIATAGSTYANNATTAHLRMKSLLSVESDATYTVNVAAGYQILVIEVDSSNVIIKNSGSWTPESLTFKTTSNTSKIQILISKPSFPTFDMSEFTSTQVNGSFVKFMGNTLTIEMGSEKWTYTFDKRPATDADIISATKAHKDIAEVVDPARKALMASAIRSKGGSANDADAWETMAQAVEGITLGKKSASGEQNTDANGLLVVSGLTFKPSYIIAYNGTGTTGYRLYYIAGIHGSTQNNYVQVGSAFNNTYTNALINNTGFTIGGTSTVANALFKWVAYE